MAANLQSSWQEETLYWTSLSLVEDHETYTPTHPEDTKFEKMGAYTAEHDCNSLIMKQNDVLISG